MIREVKLAVVPWWVIDHPAVRGNGTRIAVYTGLQALAWQYPEREWKSTRDIAAAVGELIGLAVETCRKHLGALRDIGALQKTPDEIIIKHDEPPRPPRTVTAAEAPAHSESADFGHGVGPHRPKSGTVRPNPPRDTSADLERTERTHSVGLTTHASSATSADGVRSSFDEFWSHYPRKTAKRAAEAAYRAALKRKAKPSEILDGVRARATWWVAARTPQDKIPHAATWLNGDRWGDVLEPVPVPEAKPGERTETAPIRASAAPEFDLWKDEEP